MFYRGVLCLLLSCLTISALAADGIGILKFQKSAGVADDVRAQVEAFVYESFVKERRFNVLERTQLEALAVERFLQEAMSDDQRLELEEKGARWIVIGEVNQASIDSTNLDSGNKAYTAVVSFGMRILDVKTGQVAYSEQFSSSSGNLGDLFKNMLDDKTSPGGAMRAALRDIEKPLARFIDQAFPIHAQIVSIEKFGRGGKAQEVLIAKGPADGVTPKTKMIAFVRSVLEVNGEKLAREQEIAQLVVVRSEGDHLSVCKVGKGGEQLSARIDAGETVYAKVR